MRWLPGSANTFPRWPNTTGWPSAWDLQVEQNTTHVVNYTIEPGWATSLVSNYWLLGRKNNRGQELYGGDFWQEGAKRVQYDELTLEADSFTIPGIPDGRSSAQDAYFNETSNHRHYWSSFPTNETTTYNTTFKVWGAFTTFVTHLSDNQATLDCHMGSGCASDATPHSQGRFESENIMQCPFQFRCFSPESAAGGPNCHRNFPTDYIARSLNTKVHARKF
jgi:hypothetical protein